MQIIAPNYYENFKCIANNCKHSCCIGWEIDIDPDTLDIYENVKGEWGERFKNSISYDGGTPHFITDQNGRCAFLNKNGLCDIISAFGEDGLCQICYDHPRFRNFYSGRVEIGLGLCCEAAAELILNWENKVCFVAAYEEEENLPSTNEEGLAFCNRDKILNIFQNRNLTIKQRINEVAKLYNITLFTENLADLVNKYRNLERLDKLWDEFLNKTEEKNLSFEQILDAADAKIPTPTEQLFCYFLYRYFAAETIKGNEKGAVNFILEATYICLAVTLSYYGDLNAKNLCEVCRMFSSETEYSEENVESLLNR